MQSARSACDVRMECAIRGATSGFPWTKPNSQWKVNGNAKATAKNDFQILVQSRKLANKCKFNGRDIASLWPMSHRNECKIRPNTWHKYTRKLVETMKLLIIHETYANQTNNEIPRAMTHLPSQSFHYKEVDDKSANHRSTVLPDKCTSVRASSSCSYASFDPK